MSKMSALRILSHNFSHNLRSEKVIFLEKKECKNEYFTENGKMHTSVLNESTLHQFGVTEKREKIRRKIYS